MRLATILSAVLAATVITEAAVIVRTRSQLRTMAERVQQLSADLSVANREDAVPASRIERGGTKAGASPAIGAVRAPAALPPPRLAVSGAAPGPSPAEGARLEARARSQRRWEERRQRRLESIRTRLGLDAELGRQLSEIVTAGETARYDLHEKFVAGGISGSEMTTRLASLRDRDDQQLRQLLGEERMRELRQLERQEREADVASHGEPPPAAVGPAPTRPGSPNR
jgi:hypothetical protein